MTSDDFKDDWYGWLTNQCGHIVLGLFVSCVAHYAGLWWLYAPLGAALTYWVVVELWAQRNRLWRDGIADTFFVMCGACVLPAVNHGNFTLAAVAGASGAGLTYGTWRRL